MKVIEITPEIIMRAAMGENVTLIPALPKGKQIKIIDINNGKVIYEIIDQNIVPVKLGYE